MDTIITDGGKYEISNNVADLLWSLFIKQYQSEPYHQHQTRAMLSGCQEVHPYPHESHRSASPLLVTMTCICLLSFECHSLTCP